MQLLQFIAKLRKLDNSVDISIIKGISTYRGAYDPAIGLYYLDSGCELFEDISSDDAMDYDYRLVKALEVLPSTPSGLADFLESSIGLALEGYKGGYQTIYDITDVYPSSTWGDVSAKKLKSISVVDNILVLNS